MLPRSGLGPALTSYAARHGRSDALTVDPSVARRGTPSGSRRPPTSAAPRRWSRHRGLTVTLTQVSDSFVVSVSGLAAGGFDRIAVADRIEACGGTLDVVDAVPEPVSKGS